MDQCALFSLGTSNSSLVHLLEHSGYLYTIYDLSTIYYMLPISLFRYQLVLSSQKRLEKQRGLRNTLSKTYIPGSTHIKTGNRILVATSQTGNDFRHQKSNEVRICEGYGYVHRISI